MKLESLVDRIDKEYKKLGHTLGWRFLTSPRSTLSPCTRAVFVTLNPGGNEIAHEDQRESCEDGSAYVVERWKNHPPAEAPLQKQIQLLYRRLNWDFRDVLSGQLVPFRSPSWKDLPRRRESLTFGETLWKDILRYVCPEMVVVMGTSQLRAPMRRILGDGISSQDILVGWGSVKAGLDVYSACRLVSLPHLSRFPIMRRVESQEGLDKLFS